MMDAVATRVTYTGSVVSGLVCCPPCGKATREGGPTGASCATGKETRGMASLMWRRFMRIHLPFAAFPASREVQAPDQDGEVQGEPGRV